MNLVGSGLRRLSPPISRSDLKRRPRTLILLVVSLVHPQENTLIENISISRVHGRYRHVKSTTQSVRCSCQLYLSFTHRPRELWNESFSRDVPVCRSSIEFTRSVFEFRTRAVSRFSRFFFCSTMVSLLKIRCLCQVHVTNRSDFFFLFVSGGLCNWCSRSRNLSIL